MCNVDARGSHEIYGDLHSATVVDVGASLVYVRHYCNLHQNMSQQGVLIFNALKIMRYTYQESS